MQQGRQWHNPVFHITPDSGNDMYAIIKKHFKKELRNVFFISKQFTPKRFRQCFDALVVTNSYLGGIYEGYSRTFSKTNGIQKKHH